LNFKQIRYHIRIRENFYVNNPRNGMRLKASRLFSRLRCGESECLHRIYYVNGQLCYLSASKVKNRKGQSVLQIVISFNQPQNAQELYRERWKIETAFKALKSSGFNIEDTHLTDIKRIEKLFSPVRLLSHGCMSLEFTSTKTVNR
jgi:IS4 transposase